MLICDKELRDLWEIFATIPANPRIDPPQCRPAALWCTLSCETDDPPRVPSLKLPQVPSDRRLP